MQVEQSDLVKVLTTNHPARPYLILGGLLAGMGLMRNRLSSLPLLLLGGALVARGYDEMQKVQHLHGGNYHGVNAPPANQ